MTTTPWKDADSLCAKQIWTEYQRSHDLSQQSGQTAGIDPASGRIWFGQSIEEVVQKRDADGIDGPLYFERIGAAAYFRKGGRH